MAQLRSGAGPPTAKTSSELLSDQLSQARAAAAAAGAPGSSGAAGSSTASPSRSADHAPPVTLMGVLNVTPDSFSDGGRYLAPDVAIERGIELVAEGAAIVDVGGESTRPGAEPVPLEQELGRVLPVVEGIAAAATSASISIDTRKSAVAAATLHAGASIVNDVSALRSDPELASVVADSGAYCCLMHMRGEPATMQTGDGPWYDDVVDDVRAFLAERIEYAIGEGIPEERLLIDPGIGFGKTIEHNLELLRRLSEIAQLGPPVVIGTSRKGFIGRLAALAAGSSDPVGVERRLPGTIATNVLALAGGASVFRVHDVAPLRDALVLAAATLGRRWTSMDETLAKRI